jgi:outer membrane protein assembly factor BamB
MTAAPIVLAAKPPLGRIATYIASLVLLASLAGCSLWGAGNPKPVPADLGPNVAVLGVRQVWSTRVGRVDIPLDVHVNGDTVTLASSDGSVVAVDAGTGVERWRAVVGEPLSAGVGSDGRTAAVVTRANSLIVLEGGKEKWRQPLPARVFTSPLVAGGEGFFALSRPVGNCLRWIIRSSFVDSAAPRRTARVASGGGPTCSGRHARCRVLGANGRH